MKMFNLINIGERAGSGVPNIFNVWNDEGFVEPEIEERFDPDRTILTLSFAKKQAKKTKENIEMIKKYLEEHGESKTNDIAEHINLSPARTRALLKEIKEVQVMGGNSNRIEELRMAVSNSEDVKQLMLDMIQEMDLDIVDFRVVKDENDRIDVYTKHMVEVYEAELNLFDESSGTKKLFGLMPFIADSLLSGTTLVIDELDAKIHPVLLRHIIMMFNDMNINKKKAQLIFTSHDLSTMNSEVFRRDEIWFVAKGNAQNSQLYSLVEFKNEKGESVRKDAKFDKQYLEGKYGADPYLRRIIDWGKVNA